MTTIGMVGRKCGMTQIFADNGTAIPVTVIELAPNRITQVKTKESDGYDAVQVTIGKRRLSRVTKPMAGHFAKANVEPGVGLWELRLSESQATEVNQFEGIIAVDRVFAADQLVDVTGISKGKGFAGVIKRHHFSMQDATHGNSLSHRAPGSIGQRQSPGRVFKNKKMPGQLGNKQITAQGLRIIRIDAERNLMLLKGAIPGAPGGIVIVKPSVKAKSGENTAQN